MNLKTTYQDYLAAVLNRQCKSTKEYIDQYRPVFANNRHVAGFNQALKEFIFTLNVADANGSHFTDPDGNKYLDMSMGFGVHLFGHRPAFIEDALQQQIEKGITLGPLYRDAAHAAQLLHELTGNDRCAFYNSGTEAVMVAMRVAKAATQKKKIVIFEGSYHGTHDSLLGFKASADTHLLQSSVPGITQNIVNETLLLQYGSEQSLNIIKTQCDEIAGVLIEPVMSRHPELKNVLFLKKLRSICTELHIALIFDEVITGFRAGNGGAAELFQIQPDIVTYGKIAGGGMPIGIVAGKKQFIDFIDGGQWQYGNDTAPESPMTFTAGTFNHHPLSMAAATSVLEFLKENKGALQHALNDSTEKMCNELNAFFAKEGYQISLVCFSSLFRFLLKGHAKLIFYSLLKEKIYIWEGRNCFLSTSHSEKDLDFFKRKVEQCCYELEASGLLPRKFYPQRFQKTIGISANISIHKILDAAKLAFACRYLFTTIPVLRQYDCHVMTGQHDAATITNTAFHVSIHHNGDATLIDVIADRSVCDGWSLILFFKWLSRTYNALTHSLPLPPYEEHTDMIIQEYKHDKPVPPCYKAATISSSIGFSSFNTYQDKHLFPYLLTRFQKAIEERKAYLNIHLDKISVPVAGQLYHRKLKAFGQYTLHKEILCTQLKEASACDDLASIDQLIKGRNNSHAAVQDRYTRPEIVFNMDNLDFHLSFDAEPANLVPSDEPETFYPLVCNVSKLHSAFMITLKYAVDQISTHEAEQLLKTYLNILNKNSVERI